MLYVSTFINNQTIADKIAVKQVDRKGMRHEKDTAIVD